MPIKSLHRICGWLLLLPFAFMASTGILLALSEQIERVIEPKLFSIQPGSAPALEIEELQARLAPRYGDSLTIAPGDWIFDNVQASYTDQSGAVRQLWINPTSAGVLADRPITDRLYHRVSELHRLGHSSLAIAVSVGGALVLLSGLWLFPTHKSGQYFWHSQIMLIATPFALWQAVTGVMFTVDNTTIHLHHSPWFVWRLLLVMAMLMLVSGMLLVFARQGR